MNTEELKAIVDGLSEDDAIRLSSMFDRKFGWTGVTYTRSDAEDAYRRAVGDDNAAIGDDYWEFVQDSYDWTTGLQDILPALAWTVIDRIAREYVEG